MSELYPQLQLDGNNFRLSKCCEVLASLEREAVHYDKVRKKYNRARNVFAQVGAGTGFSSVILSVGGLGTGLTGVGLPIVISLGAPWWYFRISFDWLWTCFEKIIKQGL